MLGYINLAISTFILIKLMATKEQLSAVLDDIQSSVANVQADIEKLTEDLASAGIPDDLLARAQAISDNLKSVADITPDTEA